MAFKTKNKNDFSASIRNPLEHDENVVFIKGGSVIIEDMWVVFNNLRIDVSEIINQYVQNTSRRLFNTYNGILYVLITLNKSKQIEVVPSISYNKKSFGDVKIFEDLSGKLPLILIKLQQDGSSNLRSFKTITKNDIEVYKGYGNFTLRGEKGDIGDKGITGMYGMTGIEGETGYKGIMGQKGETGLSSYTYPGETGLSGADGVMIPAILLDRS
jgi:hypothetical protein